MEQNRGEPPHTPAQETKCRGDETEICHKAVLLSLLLRRQVTPMSGQESPKNGSETKLRSQAVLGGGFGDGPETSFKLNLGWQVVSEVVHIANSRMNLWSLVQRRVQTESGLAM